MAIFYACIYLSMYQITWSVSVFLCDVVVLPVMPIKYGK